MTRAHDQSGRLGHEHDHDEHGHVHPHEYGYELGHSHPHGGVRGFLYGLFVPHTHDAADSIDDALEASVAGVWALKISLFVLLGTTMLQFVLILLTGSVALLADTIHNFSDALTALPLWIAFVLGRRAATRRYSFGYGRAEDLAGLFIVASILVLLGGTIKSIGARLMDTVDPALIDRAEHALEHTTGVVSVPSIQLR